MGCSLSLTTMCSTLSCIIFYLSRWPSVCKHKHKERMRHLWPRIAITSKVTDLSYRQSFSCCRFVIDYHHHSRRHRRSNRNATAFGWQNSLCWNTLSRHVYATSRLTPVKATRKSSSLSMWLSSKLYLLLLLWLLLSFYHAYFILLLSL